VHAEHLFRRDVRAGADRDLELFGEQVGQVGVMREAEVDQRDHPLMR
jgi:hypothetical protein